jgi:hypothetical protein
MNANGNPKRIGRAKVVKDADPAAFNQIAPRGRRY